MRAFVWKVHKFIAHDGKEFNTLREGQVSPEYKSLATFTRYFLKNLKGLFYVELFYNWDNRYGKPSLSFNWSVE